MLTTQFWLFLSIAYPKSRTFQFRVLWKQAGAQQGGRQDGQETWPELAKGMFHNINAIYSVYKLREPLRRGADCGLGMGWVSVIVWLAAALYITCFYRVFSLPSFYYYIGLINLLISIVKLLSQPMSFIACFPPDSPPQSPGMGESEGTVV